MKSLKATLLVKQLMAVVLIALSVTLFVAPPHFTANIQDTDLVQRGYYDGYYFKVPDTARYSKLKEAAFPKWNEDPNHSERSSLRLYQCGTESLPRHDSSVRVYDAVGGGMNHRQDHVFFAKLASCEDGTNVSWPVIPNSIRGGLVILCLLIGLFLIQNELSRIQHKALGSKLLLKIKDYIPRSDNVAFSVALIFISYYFIQALINLPTIPYIAYDSDDWVISNVIAAPYFGWLLNSFEFLDKIFQRPALGYQVFILLSFFSGFSWFIYELSRAVVRWSAPFVVLFVCGADAVNYYWFGLLSEAPAIGLIYSILALSLLCIRAPSLRKLIVLGVLVGFASGFRASLVFLIPFYFIVLFAQAIHFERRSLTAAFSVIVSCAMLMFVVPKIVNGKAPSQTGIVMITTTYHLVRDEEKLSPEALEVYLALKVGAENHSRIDNPVDEFNFDQNNLVAISLLAQKEAEKIIRRDPPSEYRRISNDILSKSSLEYLKQDPIEFFRHGIEHAFRAIPIQGFISRHEWLGDRFNLGQENASEELEQFVKATGEYDIKSYYEETTRRGVQRQVPFGFDFTDSVLSERNYIVAYFLTVISAFVGLPLFLMQRGGRLDYLLPSILISICAVGHLLVTGITSAVIVRYAVIAEVLILSFIPVAITSYALLLRSFYYSNFERRSDKANYSESEK